MKAINEYRNTKKFNIGGTHVEHLSRIYNYCESNNLDIIAVVGKDKDIFEYSIRVVNMDNKKLIDYILRIRIDYIKILEEKEIK